VDGKYLMRFQSETSAFKFFWHSVDVAFTHIKGQNEENQYFSIRTMATLLDCKTIFFKASNKDVINFTKFIGCQFFLFSNIYLSQPRHQRSIINQMIRSQGVSLVNLTSPLPIGNVINNSVIQVKFPSIIITGIRTCFATITGAGGVAE